MPLKVNIEDKATYFNLGDWISYYSYGEFDGKNLDLKYFKKSINK
jgi:UDP-2,3-diacylglucosamine hydrolase